MRRLDLLPVVAAGLVAIGAPTTAAARPHPPHAPAVVELFTAQGCADCVKADQDLAELAQRKGVIALTWPVDYWDYEGWTDTFAQPGFADRQRAYARRLKVREIYTPEVVVDGAAEASGVDRPAIDALLSARTAPSRDAPKVSVSLADARVRVTSGAAKPLRGEVWLVRYDPKARSVKVKSGDNRGKTVVQKDVVRELTRLGSYARGVRSYTIPKASEDGLATVVMLQAPRGGKILAVGTDGTTAAGRRNSPNKA